METLDGMLGGWSHIGRCRTTSRVRGYKLVIPYRTAIHVRSSGSGRVGIGRSPGEDLNIGLREKASIRCPCSRLTTFHCAPRTQYCCDNGSKNKLFCKCLLP